MPKKKNKMDDIQKIILDEVREIRREVKDMNTRFVTKDMFWRVNTIIITVAGTITAIVAKIVGLWK